MEINNTNNISTQTPTSIQTENNKQFKSFWPVIIIATLSALVGGLVVWSVNNTNLEQDALSLLPGSSYSKVHEQVEKDKVTQNQTYSMLAEAGEIQAKNWLTYKNQEYGFKLSFPPTWEGYKVFISSGSNGVGAPTYLSFSMPTVDKLSFVASQTEQVYGYASIFEITVIAKERQYQGTGTKMAEDKDNVYYYTVNGVPGDLKNINFETQKIISTFEFIK